MLFPDESRAKEYERITRQFQKRNANHEKLARQLIEIDPMFAPAYATLGMCEAIAGRMQEAEKLLWQAMTLSPTAFPIYDALANLEGEMGNADLSQRLIHLSIWLAAFSDTVPESATERFRQTVPDAGDPEEPETFRRLAIAADRHMKDLPYPAEVEERLRPHSLLIELLKETEAGISRETLQAFREHAKECLPVLRGALCDWFREMGGVSETAACMIIAILGEIGDAEILDNLMEVSEYGDEFAHTQWAIHRLATRMPEQALEVFRRWIPESEAWLRCAMAESLYLMDPMAGTRDLLSAMLDDFPARAAEPDTVALLNVVVAALRKHGDAELARTLEGRCEKSLSRKVMSERRKSFSPDQEFVPLLVSEGIVGLDIEDVCIERVLADERDFEEGDDGEEFDEDFEDEGEVEEEPGDEQDPSHVLGLIVDASLEYNNDRDHRRAMELYFGPNFRGNLDESDVGRFAHWVVFDFRNPRTRQTALERFAKENARNLSADQAAFLQSLRPVRLGLYQVESVEKGRGVALQDLYSDERSFVQDESSSYLLLPSNCLFARLHQFEGVTRFVGDGEMFTKGLLPEIQAKISGDSAAAGQTPAEYVAANSHQMHQWIEERLDDGRNVPEIHTGEGDEMELSQGHYQILDRDALLNALRARADLIDETKPEEPGEYQFGWLESPSKSGATRSLGHIAVIGDRLRLETISRERLKKGGRMLEKIAKHAIRHLGDSFETPEQAMRRKGSPAGE
jgi:hypothetical protein